MKIDLILVDLVSEIQKTHGLLLSMFIVPFCHFGARQSISPLSYFLINFSFCVLQNKKKHNTGLELHDVIIVF